MDSVVSTKNEGVPALNPSLRGKKAADFELERYKFILQEIRFLNENTQVSHALSNTRYGDYRWGSCPLCRLEES